MEHPRHRVAIPETSRDFLYRWMVVLYNKGKRIISSLQGCQVASDAIYFGKRTGNAYMVKKRVYVETSVISYLTARPASDYLKRAHQQLTAVWWERRSDWDCFLTTTVMDEIARGDSGAAAKRREKALHLPEQLVAPEAGALADLLVTRKLIPASTAADAYHLALAAFYQAHYLLTWNQMTC